MQKWLVKLINDGYKYAFKLSLNDKEVYATKENMVNNSFTDDTIFDVYTLNKRESWNTPYGIVVNIGDYKVKEENLF